MKSFFPVLLFFALAVSVQSETMIFDASVSNTPGTKGNVFGVVMQHKNGLLVFKNTVKREWPGIQLSGKWQIGPNEVLVIELVNQGSVDTTVGCRLDSSGADPGKGKRTFEQKITLAVIVGTHWFQYGDQPTTGWGHAPENYQCGLVDVCDTPYPETVGAVKQIGKTMYNIRGKQKR